MGVYLPLHNENMEPGCNSTLIDFRLKGAVREFPWELPAPIKEQLEQGGSWDIPFYNLNRVACGIPPTTTSFTR